MKITAIALALLVAALAGGSARAAQPWTLQRAIDHALEHNPDSRLALQRIAFSRASLQQAHAAFWPKVQIESSYVWTNNPVTVFGATLNQESFSQSLDFNDVPSIDNLNLKGTLNVPLFAGGAHLAGSAAARAGIAAAEHQRRAVQNTLAFEVARTYFTVLKARALIQATAAAVAGFEQNLAIANKRLAAGTLLKADVLDVEVRLAQAREDLLRAKNANTLALRALRRLLGIGQGTVEIAEETPAVQTPAAGAAARRAELVALDKQLEAAEAAIRRARAGYFPRVDGFASLQLDAGIENEGSGVSYVAGLMLTWNAWDGWATRARVAQGQAELSQTREQQRKLRLAIDFELEQARIQLAEAKERLEVTQRAIDQAKESVELTRARFEQGLALATQLIDAETALTAAQVRRAEAAADGRIAAAALRKALGLPQISESSEER